MLVDLTLEDGSHVNGELVAERDEQRLKTFESPRRSGDVASLARPRP